MCGTASSLNCPIDCKDSSLLNRNSTQSCQILYCHQHTQGIRAVDAGLIVVTPPRAAKQARLLSSSGRNAQNCWWAHPDRVQLLAARWLRGTKVNVAPNFPIGTASDELKYATSAMYVVRASTSMDRLSDRARPVLSIVLVQPNCKMLFNHRSIAFE